LLAMTENPRSTIVSLAERLGLSRNTVQSRLAALEAGQGLQGYDRRLHGAARGWPLTAFMGTEGEQARPGAVIGPLREIAEAGQALQGYDRRLHAASLGYPLTAFMETQVDQPRLEHVIGQLREIPEVVQVHGLSGLHDILVRCVCRDTDDLYRVNKLLLGCE